MKIAFRHLFLALAWMHLGVAGAGGARADEHATIRNVKQAPPAESQAALSGPFDLKGRPIDPLAHVEAKGVVLIFVATDCPIANRYAPEVERLYETYGGRKIAFWLVYADPRDDAAKIAKHFDEYRYKVTAIRDPQHRLVKRCGVNKTPESVLLGPGGKQLYRGRIDDRFTGYGKSRIAPTRRELEDAIDSVLEGRPVRIASTEVVGCFIPDADR